MCVCVWWRWTTCKHQQTPSVVRSVSSVFICVSSVLEIYTKSICSWNWMFLGCDFPMYWGQCTSNPFTVFCSQGCLGRISNSFWNQDVMLDGSWTQRELNDSMSSFDPSAATVRRARHGGKLKKRTPHQGKKCARHARRHKWPEPFTLCNQIMTCQMRNPEPRPVFLNQRPLGVLMRQWMDILDNFC